MIKAHVELSMDELLEESKEELSMDELLEESKEELLKESILSCPKWRTYVTSARVKLRCSARSAAIATAQLAVFRDTGSEKERSISLQGYQNCSPRWYMCLWKQMFSHNPKVLN